MQRTFLIPSFYSLYEWENLIPDKIHYTYEDYEKLPEGAPYQLITGELVMSPSPTTYHQEISGELEFELRSFVKKRLLGYVYDAPLDVYLTDNDVYQPDILFIRKGRENIIGRKIQGPPDLVIEILSHSTAYYDLRKKFRIYEQTGVCEYWIVDPDLKKIEVYFNENKKFCLYAESEKEGTVSSKILEGFSVSLCEIFNAD